MRHIKQRLLYQRRVFIERLSSLIRSILEPYLEYCSSFVCFSWAHTLGLFARSHCTSPINQDSGKLGQPVEQNLLLCPVRPGNSYIGRPIIYFSEYWDLVLEKLLCFQTNLFNSICQTKSPITLSGITATKKLTMKEKMYSIKSSIMFRGAFPFVFLSPALCVFIMFVLFLRPQRFYYSISTFSSIFPSFFVFFSNGEIIECEYSVWNCWLQYVPCSIDVYLSA